MTHRLRETREQTVGHPGIKALPPAGTWKARMSLWGKRFAALSVKGCAERRSGTGLWRAEKTEGSCGF